MITNKRIELKPIKYEWAFESWRNQNLADWYFWKIPMSDDIRQWHELPENEKKSLEKILMGFAQAETHIGDYWSKLIPTWFPVPEIKAMAQKFAASETMHAYAYSYLNETLDLNDFTAFLEDEATMNKLEVLMDAKEDDTLENKAKSLAVFSAAAEGIQLFSSFSILLSFRKENLLKGISQQMIYSIRDESLHSETGCKLFRTLCEENEGLKEKLQNEILNAIKMAINLEFDFIDSVFSEGDLRTISKDELKEFMKDRANRKAIELGYFPIYKIDKDLLKGMDWFYQTVGGTQQTDFFAQHETNYAEINEDWKEQRNDKAWNGLLV